jgi:8-amino-3,8-dideoxy-alpha-D-manno-octulosonate transaminase
MYHFINQWDHIKEMRTASKLPIQVLGSRQNYSELKLPVSQDVIGRLISFGIRCTWKEEEIEKLGTQILQCMKELKVTA